jgi:hypothetical protein
VTLKVVQLAVVLLILLTMSGTAFGGGDDGLTIYEYLELL